MTLLIMMTLLSCFMFQGFIALSWSEEHKTQKQFDAVMKHARNTKGNLSRFAFQQSA